MMVSFLFRVDCTHAALALCVLSHLLHPWNVGGRGCGFSRDGDRPHKLWKEIHQDGRFSLTLSFSFSRSWELLTWRFCGLWWTLYFCFLLTWRFCGLFLTWYCRFFLTWRFCGLLLTWCCRFFLTWRFCGLLLTWMFVTWLWSRPWLLNGWFLTLCRLVLHPLW